MFKNKKAFTLIEILIVSAILSMVLTIVISSYKSLTNAKLDIFARSTLAKQTNFLVEKLNILMKNYSIDYEEYFNRRMVGCNSA
jgi:prepilin-type N-terminal cleavage/methylation domain-containing protein